MKAKALYGVSALLVVAAVLGLGFWVIPNKWLDYAVHPLWALALGLGHVTGLMVCRRVGLSQAVFYDEVWTAQRRIVPPSQPFEVSAPRWLFSQRRARLDRDGVTLYALAVQTHIPWSELSTVRFTGEKNVTGQLRSGKLVFENSLGKRLGAVDFGYTGIDWEPFVLALKRILK